MGKPLISSDDYTYLLQTGRSYDGYVWTKEGKVYYATYNFVTMVSEAPSWPHRDCGVLGGTAFFDVVKTPVITEASLGNNDVLYTENGDFVTVIASNDPIAGEIKILKDSFKYNELFLTDPSKINRSDIVGIEDMKTLSDNAYSKIFTHILSLMKEVDLNTVSQKKVISCFISEGGASYTPSTNELKIDPGHGSEANFGKKKSSKTVWNIFNMLGAHEYLGHKEIGWKNDTNTHYLVYLFQKRHRTWKKTTEDFKELMEGNLNDYIKTNRYFEKNNVDYKDIPTIRHDSKILRENNLWPYRDLSGQDSIRFYQGVAKNIQNPSTNRNPFKK